MTPEQVSTLSDKELKDKFYCVFGVIPTTTVNNEGEVGYEFDNWNGVMPLAFQYGVRVKTNFHKTMTIAKQLVSADMGGDYFNNKTAHKNPLRAICQCLVLIAMEGK